MAGIVVIVAYRPKPGREKELLEIVRNRVPTLRKEDLVTDRAPVMTRGAQRFGESALEEVNWPASDPFAAASRIVPPSDEGNPSHSSPRRVRSRGAVGGGLQDAVQAVMP